MPTFDFPYILALSDHLSSSAQASKDAAKALRTEFKVRNQTLLPLSPLPTEETYPLSSLAWSTYGTRTSDPINGNPHAKHRSSIPGTSRLEKVPH